MPLPAAAGSRPWHRPECRSACTPAVCEPAKSAALRQCQHANERILRRGSVRRPWACRHRLEENGPRVERSPRPARRLERPRGQGGPGVRRDLRHARLAGRLPVHGPRGGREAAPEARAGAGGSLGAPGAGRPARAEAPAALHHRAHGVLQREGLLTGRPEFVSMRQRMHGVRVFWHAVQCAHRRRARGRGRHVGRPRGRPRRLHLRLPGALGRPRELLRAGRRGRRRMRPRGRRPGRHDDGGPRGRAGELPSAVPDGHLRRLLWRPALTCACTAITPREAWRALIGGSRDGHGTVGTGLVPHMVPKPTFAPKGPLYCCKDR
mmetsp:Transcript_61291/g.172837  ORF Transcript_61291/g.172837 Transcript_61291/m.172837 type:complete len:322 (+) Transcript_61291:734-1699(+)